MKSRTTVTKRDIVVVFGCAFFLLMNLGAINSGGRRRAKEAVCLSNLRQWGVIWSTYCQNNDGYFCNAGTLGWKRGTWILAFRPYMETRTTLLCCPEATIRHPSGVPWGGPFNTYVVGDGGFEDRREEGSYGANCWIYNPRPGQASIQGRPTAWNWRTCHVANAAEIPLFLDSMYMGGAPYEVGTRGDPPAYDGQWLGYNREMMHFCIDRHNGAVNGLFMDWSARKIALKELWTLKWYRVFNTNGPWTKAGGVRPEDWPEWMRDFKEY